MNILLIRHGQSEWNASGRWQGQADPPLTELGREQAHLAVETVRELSLEKLFSSDLRRALETAGILASGLGLDRVLIEPLLRERNAGEFTGLTSEEIEERFPGFLSSGERPAGYEPDPALLERLMQALAAVTREEEAAHLKVIGIVAHGGLIRLLEETYGSEPYRPIPNLSGRWIHYDMESITLGERILLLDEAHLTTPGQI